ncbi:Importin alpha subunit (Karyopherin alpha subunit) (Serine-rich RNA polymerase I suppressor protein) [Tulasnella sp. 408]|nr:Importin alpha subunit (Karyopherin alpha subunit) (Serine-rich RNA polymerase I suppressor protein) [Tulasnella sp. 408]
MVLRRNVLHFIGYFLDGDNDVADVVIDLGLLPALLALIEGENQELCRMALYHASNIAVGSQPQIHAFLDCGFLEPVVLILLDDFSPTRCRHEAGWTVANLSTRVSGDEKAEQAFIEGGGVAGLSAALLLPDRGAKELAISGITSLFEGHDSEGSQSQGSLLAAIRSSSAPQNLRAIRYSRGGGPEDHELRKACHTLLTHHFPEYSKRARV